MAKYPSTYVLSSQVYRDTSDQNDQSYRNIITINLLPRGPLGPFVQRINMPYLSPFQFGNNSSSRRLTHNCVLAIGAMYTYGGVGFGTGTGRLMGDDEIPDLFSFLLSNGYSIDTGLTRMMNTSEVRLDNKNIIAFITYIG